QGMKTQPKSRPQAHRPTPQSPQPRRTGRDESKLVQAIMGHPVPATLAGLTLAWLMFEAARRADPQAALEKARQAVASAGEGLAHGADRAGKSASDAAATVGEYAGAGLAKAGKAVKGGSSAVGSGAGTLARGARD